MADARSRRSFISTGAAAAAAGAAALAASKTAEAAFTAPDPNKKLRIGIIGTGGASFATYCWSDIIEGTKPGTRSGNFGTPFLNMSITQVWDPNPQSAQQFATRLGAEVAKSFDGMLGKVDGIIFADMGNTGYMKILAKPYLEAGVPAYLTRPFAYSLRDIDEILESAAKGNTPIIATSKYEHYKEVGALKSKIAAMGRIRMVQAAANTSDFPMHFHIQNMMMKILGYNVKSASLQIESESRTNYVHETFLYPGNEKQPPFMCTIDGSGISDSFYIRVYGDNQVVEASMLRGYGSWQDDLFFRYAPQVLDMQRTFYGKNYEPYDIVRKKTEIYLTAHYSHLEKGGAPVPVGSVPVDWRVTSPSLNTRADWRQ